MNSTSDPVARVLQSLRELGHEPRKAGAGWSAKCPAHDDRAPSLSVNTGDDGRALLCCHAGCQTELIVGALGMKSADLFPDDPVKRNGHATRATPKPAKPARGARTFPTAREAVADLERRHGPRSAAWTYTNAAGEPVGVIVRWDTPTGKRIRPVSRTPDGWVLGGMPAPRPLYRLPELHADHETTIYIVEGEKAADAVARCGLLATTSPHGSKSARQADWGPLKGRDVVILPDHDDAGEGYARDVVRLAQQAGARSVRIVRLADRVPGAPSGFDLADLLDLSGGDTEGTRRAVVELAEAAEPEAVAGSTPLPRQYEPIPVDRLPEPARSFVVETSKAMGCDAAMIAVPLLAALASVIGNSHVLRVKPGWVEPSVLWAAIVTESGGMKSPALHAAVEAVHARQLRNEREHREAMRRWEPEHARWRAETKKWEKGGGGGGPPAEPIKPVLPRTWTGEPTVESLLSMLSENPRGLLLVRDELSGWFGSFGRYTGGRGGGDEGAWLEMHGGRPCSVDRKGTGFLHVPRAAVSIVGGIQPGVLTRTLGTDLIENGMAARFLFVMPPRLPKQWANHDPDPAAVAAMHAVFETIYNIEPGRDEHGDLVPFVIHLGPGAEGVARAFVDRHGAETVERQGGEAAAWSKLEAAAFRLALVLHLCEWAAGDRARAPGDIETATLLDAIVLVEWFKGEAERIYSMLSGDHADLERADLAGWVRARGGSVTARDLAHGRRKYKDDPEGAERALTDLVEAGFGAWRTDTHGPAGGRPARRFVLGSGVTVTETTEIIGVQGGYGDGDARGETESRSAPSPTDGDWGEV